MIVSQGNYINLGQQLMIKTTNNVKKWSGDVANFRNSHPTFLAYFTGEVRSQLNIHDDVFLGSQYDSVFITIFGNIVLNLVLPFLNDPY